MKLPADKYSIPYATLYRHVQYKNSKKKLVRFIPVLTPEQEESLREYLQKKRN